MAKQDSVSVNEKETSCNDISEVNLHSNSFSNRISGKSKHGSDKSFAEVVDESTRLPALTSSSLPLSMSAILQSTSPQGRKWTPSLPTIPAGKVQLVHTNDSKPARKEKRRFKRERKSKGHQKHGSSRSHCIDEHEEESENIAWKKTLHQRQKKRIIDEGEDSLNPMPRQFRLPTLQGIPKW